MISLPIEQDMVVFVWFSPESLQTIYRPTSRLKHAGGPKALKSTRILSLKSLPEFLWFVFHDFQTIWYRPRMIVSTRFFNCHHINFPGPGTQGRFRVTRPVPIITMTNCLVLILSHFKQESTSTNRFWCVDPWFQEWTWTRTVNLTKNFPESSRITW